MKKIEEVKLKYFNSTIICGLFFLSFSADAVFYRNYNFLVFFRNPVYLCVKMIYFGVLLLVGMRVLCLDKNTLMEYKKPMIYGLPVLCLYMLCFLILYPGIWYGDEMNVIDAAADLHFVGLQGVTVTIYDMVLASLVPTPAIIQPKIPS